ncbi:flagellar protein FliS, partial [Pseudomonas syringae pv. tagetis]|uniref:flagellar export chaperone FliS n=1 Tax=Pseudomonas syringae group genomosp. 7 TaxID=251699 RepID=UPI0037706CC4
LYRSSSDGLVWKERLYHYIMTRMAEAYARNDQKILDEVAGLLITVKEGWDGIGTLK